MANRIVFKSSRGKVVPQTDSVNEAGGVSYSMGPELALATVANTGTFNDTYYGTGQ